MASMQYDVKSVRLADDGQAISYRTRVKAVYGVAGASVGSVKLYDGTSVSGELLLDLDSPAGTGNAFFVIMPGEGILFRTGVYADLTNVTGVTVIYG